MNSNHLIGFKLSRFNLDLSKKEALLCFKAYFEVEEFFCFNNLYILSINGNLKDILKHINKLAFAKEAFVIVKDEDWLRSIFELAKSLNTNLSKEPSFKICVPETLSKDQKDVIIKETASLVLKKKPAWRVSLSNPDLVVCAFLKLEAYGFLIWTNKDGFNARRAHLKPGPHPSGIDPRLARAMVNLASAKCEILDPFCGAGGILEEVKLLGLSYLGVDISWKMINLARSNLKSRENLFIMSAFSWERQVECVVTDLPYGKNSKLDGELNLLIDEFFKHFKGLTQKIVVCTPNTYDVEEISKKHGWALSDYFDVYVHGTLTRRIHVLSSNN